MHAGIGDFCVFGSSNVLMSCYKPKPSSDIMLENIQAAVWLVAGFLETFSEDVYENDFCDKLY
jgi:hypothetical protein